MTAGFSTLGNDGIHLTFPGGVPVPHLLQPESPAPLSLLKVEYTVPIAGTCGNHRNSAPRRSPDDGHWVYAD